MVEIVSIETLAAKLVEAKKIETSAAKERKALETELAEMLPEMKKVGSKTTTHGAFKVTVKTGTLTKIDLEGMADSKAGYRPIKQIPTFDKVGWEWIQENAPADAAILAEFITTKPAKTSVTVKEVE